LVAGAVIWSYGRAYGRAPVAAHCLIRGLFWSLGIMVALMPAMNASNTDYFPISLESYARSAERAGYFHDFFFVTIVVCIVGLSDILEKFFRGEDDRIGLWWRVVFSFLALYFLMITLYSLGHFGELTRYAKTHTGVPTPTFNHDLNIIYLTLAAGIITEIVVVLKERAP
jgi:hypothetical protein